MRSLALGGLPRVAGLVAVTLLFLANCKKAEVGQACLAGQAACADEHTGLFCREGHLTTMTCLGPSGCQKVGKDDVACDNPVASVADGCNQEGDLACTSDKASALVCKAGKFVVAQPCKGPRGCTSSGEAVYCDNALAEPGDLCTEEGDAACRSDRSSFMKCVHGKFQITNGCRGPKHCTVTEKPEENKEHFECDDSITAAGDPCEDEAEESCALDKKSLDVCKAHVIALGKPCPGPAGCSYNAATSHFDCDTKKK
jgi:hypothetical protein